MSNEKKVFSPEEHGMVDAQFVNEGGVLRVQVTSLPPLLQRELDAAKQMVEADVEPTLAAAIETCIKHSGEGPFTPREIALLRAST